MLSFFVFTFAALGLLALGFAALGLAALGLVALGHAALGLAALENIFKFFLKNYQFSVVIAQKIIGKIQIFEKKSIKI